MGEPRKLDQLLETACDTAPPAPAGPNSAEWKNMPPATLIESDEPQCGNCGDAGFVRQELARDHPDFGKPYPCECRKQPADGCGLPPGRLNDTFETFNMERNPKMAAAYDRCRDVAEGRAWEALLYGSLGTGKTHLAAAAINLRRKAGDPTRFWKLSDFFQWLRETCFGGDDKEENRIALDAALKPYLEGDFLLVFDDLGTEKQTDWVRAGLYRIMDSRYERKLPTIITTNDDLERIDGRIFSRFRDGLVVCQGRDVRALGVLQAAAAGGHP